MKVIFSGHEDVVVRDIFVNNSKVSVFFVQGLINETATSDYILKPLMQAEKFKTADSESQIVELIEKGNIYFVSQLKRTSLDDIIHDAFNGCTVLVFDSEKIGISFNNAGFEKRSITEPTAENVIKGAKDSFVETLRVNTASIRRKLKTPDLKIEQVMLGEQSQTAIDIAYMDSIVDKDMLAELKSRISSVKIDGLLTTAQIEEYIVDNKNSIFPQIISTERPDKLCADLLEGRIGILADGIPFALIMPATFLQCLQSTSDYSQNFIISSTIRFMRFILLIVALTLPAFYIAITTFHFEMIPSQLSVFIEASKRGVPFPTFIEVSFMLIAFEILLEAGLRLPKTIGQSVSIVGAIIVGQAMVEAKIISPSVVVIIATAAISGFTIPNQDLSNALRLYRFVLAIGAYFIGIFGITILLLVMLIFLANLEVLGVPYLSPFVGTDYSSLKDALFRFRMPSLKKAPYKINEGPKTGVNND